MERKTLWVKVAVLSRIDLREEHNCEGTGELQVTTNRISDNIQRRQRTFANTDYIF